MEHLLAQVRPAIDLFETMLLNAFSNLRTVEAIWIREVQALARDETKRFTRIVWLQLGRRSASDLQLIKTLGAELVVRIMNQPFGLEVRVLVDELPPVDIAPSCIYRRGSGRV